MMNIARVSIIKRDMNDIFSLQVELLIIYVKNIMQTSTFNSSNLYEKLDNTSLNLTYL